MTTYILEQPTPPGVNRQPSFAKRLRSGPGPTEPDPALEEAKNQAAREQMLKQRNTIEQMVAMRLNDAMNARQSSGIEEIWWDDEDQYNGYDALNHPMLSNARKDASAKAGMNTDQVPSQRSTVFLNITKPKTDSSVSRVQEMLVPTDDKPFSVTNTPIPELGDTITRGDTTEYTLSDGTTATGAQIATAALSKAQASAALAETQIEDWFVEGSVYVELRKVIRDAGRIGTGVLKGPFPIGREDRKWSIHGQGEPLLERAIRIAPTSKAIPAEDLFPDPSCGDNIHNGAYIFERDYQTARQLRDMAKLPEYDREALVEVIRAGPGKRVRNNRYLRETPGEVQSFDSETFEVFRYYGDIPPDQLLTGGFVVPGLNDAQDDAKRMQQIEDARLLTTVPIVATVINDRVVRVSMNPMETGAFPFDVFAWEAVHGQPWGRSIPRKIGVAQRMLNAAVRALLENAGMSAGPQVIIDKNRVTPANGRYEITGRKLWYWNPGDEVKDVRFAFAAIQIDSAQVQLQAIIDFALKMADELSNLPMLLQGIKGQSPETFGGMEMLERNATAPLKAIAKQFDDSIILPHLKRWYDWLMQDPRVAREAKGDHQCQARGASVLAAREAKGNFLAQAGGLVKDPVFEINPKKWFAEFARANKFDPTTIQFTKEEAAQNEEARSKQPPPMAPQVEAAHIRAQAVQAQIQATAADSEQARQFEAQQAELDRQNELLVKEMEREIQVLEFGGRKEISFETLRTMLTKSAMEIRNKRELFASEVQLALTKGEGI